MSRVRYRYYQCPSTDASTSLHCSENITRETLFRSFRSISFPLTLIFFFFIACTKYGAQSRERNELTAVSFIFQVSRNTGILSHFVNLNIVIPEAFILGSDEHHVDVGSIINLVCIIEKVRHTAHALEIVYFALARADPLMNVNKRNSAIKTRPHTQFPDRPPFPLLIIRRFITLQYNTPRTLCRY